MAREACRSCGVAVSYSDPSLERAGLKSNAWANLVVNEGFKCFDCLGTSSCVQCGTSLGRENALVSGHDYDSGTYCGQQTCITCTKKYLSGSGHTSSQRSSSYTAPSYPSRRGVSWLRILFSPILLPLHYIFALLGVTLHFLFQNGFWSFLLTAVLIGTTLWFFLIPFIAAFFLLRNLGDYFTGYLDLGDWFNSNF